MFHQRYATNTSPVWSLAQPFAFVAHNGEINTVRGNREAVRGRRDDAGIPSRRREAADRLRDAGPLLSPGVSDSRSLDEALELLVATGWSLESALLALVPEATALRRTPHPAVAAFRRRVAGFVAPWDGPGAFVFSDGRRVGALLDRNGLRPAAWSLTADRMVAVASEAGAVPLSPGEIVRTGRLAPGELLLVDPAAGRVLTDADAKSWVLRRLPLHDAPREVFADGDGSVGVPVIEAPSIRRGCRARSQRHEPGAALPVRARRREAAPRRAHHGPRRPRAAVEHGRRHAAHRPRPRHPPGRRPPPPGVRAGHQPADRPGARARGHGPPDGARPAAGAARRDAGGRRHRARRAPGRRRPRGAARRRPRPLSRAAPGGPHARRDLAGHRRARAASRTRSTGSGPRRSRPRGVAPRSSS